MTLEARARLASYGPNELQEAARPGFWSRLLAQLNDFLVIILIVASLISLLLGTTSRPRRSWRLWCSTRCWA